MNTIYFKNKLIKIIDQKGGDDLEITIDDKIFKLIAKQNEGAGGRSHLIIESRDIDGSNKLVFLCYRSNSEVGIWRFLCWGFGNYHKGDDYVTNTYIDIRFQKFIYENYHLIPNLIINEENKKKFLENINIGYIWGQKEILFNYELKSSLLSDEYKSFVTDIINAKHLHLNITHLNNFIIKDNLSKTVMVDTSYDEFKILNLLGKCGTYWPNYVELWDKFESVHDILLESIPNFEIEVTKNRTKMRASPSWDDGRTPPSFSYDYFTYNHLGFEMRDDNVEFCTSLSIISKYLEKIMTVDLTTLKFQFPITSINNGNKIILNVYTIDVKINNRDYVMHCAKYITDFISADSFFNKKNKEYKTILNLIPKDNKITSIGLHSKYLSLGVYLCKILEYRSQSLFEHVHRMKIGSTDYNFVGHFYNNLYPLNLISFGDIVIPEDKVNTTTTFTAGDEYLDKKITYCDFLYCKKFTVLPPELKELMDIIGSSKINITDLEQIVNNPQNNYENSRQFESSVKTFFKGNYSKIKTELDVKIASSDGEEKQKQIKLKEYLENMKSFEFILGLEHQLKNNGYEMSNIILNKLFEYLNDSKISNSSLLLL